IAAVAAMMMIVGIIAAALGLVVVISMAKIFDKAGEPWWAAIIPIYSFLVLLKIVDKPAWWVVLLFVPVANFIVALIVVFALAEKFGQGFGFGVGMLLLPVVFYPMLAFGSAQYRRA
ncbi:MAG TPA: DUF5684 domain-containing protein, partial [Minicystis sp.]|nr:DUF5684 domain-containing protein [Minicystis sp.]